MKRLPFARWTQRLNLAQRMSIAFCTIVLVVLIALVASFSAFYSNQVEKAVNENISQVAVINAKTISSQFERMEIFLDALSSRSSGLHEVLLAYDGTLASCIATFESAKALVAQYADVAIQPITYQYHASLFVNPAYPLSGRLSEIYMDRAPIGGTWVFADTNLREEDWFQLAAASPNTNVWFARMENPGTIYVARCIQYYAYVDEQIELVSPGTMLIEIGSAWVAQSVDFSSMAGDALFFLTDIEGNILYSQDAQNQGKSFESIAGSTLEALALADQPILFHGAEYIAEVTRCNASIWLVTLVPSMELGDDIWRMNSALFSLAALFLLLGAVLIFMFSRQITSPILRLARHMREHELAPIPPLQSAQYEDGDIQVLYQSYNELVERIQRSTKEQVAAIQREKLLELNLLQMQINPHFLCNALNSISCVTMLRNETDIADAATALASFLRYNISPVEADVTLQREIEMTENYIEIQNFLHPDFVFIQFEVELDAQQYLLPKMLLQPLIENCVKYAQRDGCIEIMVSAYTIDGHLRIAIEDNGTGCDVDAINQTLMQDPYANGAHGFGIRNVHQRIVLKFGEAYGLHYCLSETGGVIVRMDLPIRLATEHNVML